MKKEKYDDLDDDAKVAIGCLMLLGIFAILLAVAYYMLQFFGTPGVVTMAGLLGVGLIMYILKKYEYK